MGTIEIKQRLIDRIMEVTDDFLLQELYRILNNEKEETDVYLLSKEEKGKILEAREDVKTGRVLNSDQADKEIEEWLKK